MYKHYLHAAQSEQNDFDFMSQLGNVQDISNKAKHEWRNNNETRK